MNAARWLTLAVVSAATAMLLLDVTVVNVALPAIRSDLDASFAELQSARVPGRGARLRARHLGRDHGRCAVIARPLLRDLAVQPSRAVS